jgi:hypothetical protein
VCPIDRDPIEDTGAWQWADALPDECMRFKSQVRITEHVHERIVPWQKEGAYDIEVLHADEEAGLLTTPAHPPPITARFH